MLGRHQAWRRHYNCAGGTLCENHKAFPARFSADFNVLYDFKQTEAPADFPMMRMNPRIIALNSISHSIVGGLFVLCLLLIPRSLSSQKPPAGAEAEQDFTVVLLPDTQYYSNESRGGTIKMFKAQTQWVAKNHKRENIRAVLSLGDIVNNYSGDVEREWRNADAAYRILDKSGVPYAPVLGNHDYDRMEGLVNRKATGYNRYFGPARLARHPWYGGGFPSGSNENLYITFTAGARKFLVIGLEFYPRTVALEWAQGIVDAHPGHEVLIVTHSYLDADGGRVLRGGGRGGPPDNYGLDTDNHDGEGMWTKLAKVNRNVILVLSGHVVPRDGSTVMSRRSDVGDHGNLIHQMLADYQGTANGGNGYMRILRFRPSKGVLEVTTYSPYLKAYLTDESNQFTLEYKGVSREEERSFLTPHAAPGGAPGTWLISPPPRAIPARNTAPNGSGLH